MTPPLTDEQKKKVIFSTSLFTAAGIMFGVLVTALILNKKYAKLEAQYWGM